MLLDVLLNCSSNRWSLGRGGEVKSQTVVLEFLDGLRTHYANGDIALLKVWEALHQRFHARWCKQDNHVVVERLVIAYHVAHGAIHDCLGKLDASILGNVQLLVVHITDGIDISLLVVLCKQWQESLGMASLAIEYLALAIDDILLQIVGNCLTHTEVFHCVGHVETELLTQTEVMVNRSACSENHCSMVSDGNF